MRWQINTGLMALEQSLLLRRRQGLTRRIGSKILGEPGILRKGLCGACRPGEALSRPEDGRPPVDVAIRSNELYPHESRRVRRRAVSFLDPKSFRYMIGAGKKPLMTADDITHPQHEAAYELRFLAPSDAFYTFKGTLGKRRWLPGRDGPPGADYNTLPSLKPPHRQLVAGYWRAGHRGDMTRLDEALATSDYIGAFLQVQMPIFRGNVRRAMHGHGTGAFR